MSLTTMDVVYWYLAIRILGRYSLDERVPPLLKKTMHPMGIQKQCKEGLKDQNKTKNRYITSPAYDFCRIKLALKDDDPNSSYINASKVPGHKKVYGYIISQAPLANTIDDFWKLLWQERIYSIISANNFNGTEYIEYWPKKEGTYGNIDVLFKHVEVKKYFTIRTFHVKHKDSKNWRELKQFHYTVWPDKIAPENPLSVAKLLERVNRYNRQYNRPILIHCEAGCGRSGTVLCTDICLHQARCDEEVNVFKALTTLRSQRIDGVETQIWLRRMNPEE
ncbi:Receptor-type tyrosine-protein phosphatase T [Nymphon striatum]|nr:Receptor-type tyrosine-protein phosphatase T [Nymphon striatum]